MMLIQRMPTAVFGAQKGILAHEMYVNKENILLKYWKYFIETHTEW